MDINEEMEKQTEFFTAMAIEIFATDMARDICGQTVKCKTCIGRKSDMFFRSKLDCRYYIYAKKAIEKGYCKIPDDAMLIEKKEYEELKQARCAVSVNDSDNEK